MRLKLYYENFNFTCPLSNYFWSTYYVWGSEPGGRDREPSTLASRPQEADTVAPWLIGSIALWQGPNEEISRQLLWKVKLCYFNFLLCSSRSGRCFTVMTWRLQFNLAFTEKEFMESSMRKAERRLTLLVSGTLPSEQNRVHATLWSQGCVGASFSDSSRPHTCSASHQTEMNWRVEPWTWVQLIGQKVTVCSSYNQSLYIFIGMGYANWLRLIRTSFFSPTPHKRLSIKEK